MLDMEPYTAQGIQARDKEEPPLPPQMYDLVGIVVHSGQASAGHYYSFIKEKRLDVYFPLYLAPNFSPLVERGSSLVNNSLFLRF